MDDAEAVFQRELGQRAGARFMLRAGSAEDAPFLAHLQRSVQAEAIERLGGDPAPFVSGPIAELHFRAQSLAYHSAYPLGSNYIMLSRPGDRPMGRALIDWSCTTTPAVVLVDIAVLPEARAGAIGMHLLRAFVAACDHSRRPAQLHVTPHNPARSIYRRLGFIETDAESFPVQMRRPCRRL